jgi:hypothetical protein
MMMYPPPAGLARVSDAPPTAQVFRFWRNSACLIGNTHLAINIFRQDARPGQRHEAVHPRRRWPASPPRKRAEISAELVIAFDRLSVFRA